MLLRLRLRDRQSLLFEDTPRQFITRHQTLLSPLDTGHIFWPLPSYYWWLCHTSAPNSHRLLHSSALSSQQEDQQVDISVLRLHSRKKQGNPPGTNLQPHICFPWGQILLEPKGALYQTAPNSDGLFQVGCTHTLLFSRPLMFTPSQVVNHNTLMLT